MTKIASGMASLSNVILYPSFETRIKYTIGDEVCELGDGELVDLDFGDGELVDLGFGDGELGIWLILGFGMASYLILGFGMTSW